MGDPEKGRRRAWDKLRAGRKCPPHPVPLFGTMLSTQLLWVKQKSIDSQEEYPEGSFFKLSLIGLQDALDEVCTPSECLHHRQFCRIVLDKRFPNLGIAIPQPWKFCCHPLKRWMTERAARRSRGSGEPATSLYSPPHTSKIKRGKTTSSFTTKTRSDFSFYLQNFGGT